MKHIKIRQLIKKISLKRNIKAKLFVQVNSGLLTRNYLVPNDTCIGKKKI